MRVAQLRGVNRFRDSGGKGKGKGKKGGTKGFSGKKKGKKGKGFGKKGKGKNGKHYEPYRVAKFVPKERKSEKGEHEGFFDEEEVWHGVIEKNGRLTGSHRNESGDRVEDESWVLEENWSNISNERDEEPDDGDEKWQDDGSNEQYTEEKWKGFEEQQEKEWNEASASASTDQDGSGSGISDRFCAEVYGAAKPWTEWTGKIKQTDEPTHSARR